MTIPHFEGKVTYLSYNAIVNRIKGFDDYEIIGKDESGKYDIYKIEMGNPKKPTIMVTTGVHGNEWQTVIYTLSFMEQLEYGTFPDKAMRNDLLANFHIVYMPVVNPHGLDNVEDPYLQFDNSSRRNSNNVDLNRDLVNKSQVETRIFIDTINKFKPFAYLDVHMYQPTYNLADGNNLIIGKGNNDSTNEQLYIAEHAENYAGQKVTRWRVLDNNEQMFIGYAGKLKNEHTPFTLSIISELIRPANVNNSMVRKLTDTQIFDFGSAIVYLFFEQAIQFYHNYNGVRNEDSFVNEIITPTSRYVLTRDTEGILIEVMEHKNNGQVIKSTPIRDSNGQLERIIKELIEGEY